MSNISVTYNEDSLYRGGSVTASLTLTDTDGYVASFDYVWQMSSDGSSWSDVSGATGSKGPNGNPSWEVDIFLTLDSATDSAQLGNYFRLKVITADNNAVQETIHTAATSNVVADNPPNAAPVMTDASPTLTSIDEDDVTSAGSSVASLLADTVSDSNETPVEGMAITGLDEGNGTWQYSLDGSTWSDIGTVSTSQALLLAADDLVRFVPNTENATNATFTYVAWDQTSGTAGSKVDASSKGAQTAFSIEDNTASITVTAVNDNPTLSSSVNRDLVEAGNGVAGTSTANATLTLGDLDQGDTAVLDLLNVGWSGHQADSYFTKALSYGSVRKDVGSDVVVYTLDDTNSAVQALQVGDTLTDTVVVQAESNGVTVDHTVTFTIQGTNDAPVVVT
ncbi:VCBS domain-containing protein, partial [Alphaproteobacteria bacterium]|nr:VCBS domain-containing protein [Alphaproteobacteria bacterium]